MNEKHSVQKRLRSLVTAISVLLAVSLLSSLAMLISANGQYSGVLYNVTTASEFNQEFKNSIDQKMYYYVIESQYSEGLPIAEVHAAQELAKSLIETTTQKESREAITSVLDLCENLEEKIYQIQDTSNYDERLTQLVNNVYILTSLVEEYMYNYLYFEAAELNTLERVIQRQIVMEIVIITIITAAAMVFVLRRSIRLSRSITEPIVALSRRAEEVTGGDLTVREPSDSEIYEIRTLSEGMEQMIQRLNEQMQESRQRQENLRRTELALLQAQINPHFLYNTMDTIVWLIEAEKTQEAIEMVTNLSGFFRNSLSNGEDVISLKEEERHVRSYLQIQHARYKDILEYVIDIDPALHSAMLPKLTLQPLVENALYHGIKLKRAVGTIRVTGYQEEEFIYLQVSDDGVGMTSQRLEQLRRAMESGEKLGFGAAAVNQRLQLQFGREYGLSVTSRQGEGTTVTARLPYVRKEELQ